MTHIYDDFYIQCMLFLLLVIAIGFLFDVIVDPFKLSEESDRLTKKPN